MRTLPIQYETKCPVKGTKIVMPVMHCKYGVYHPVDLADDIIFSWRCRYLDYGPMTIRSYKVYTETEDLTYISMKTNNYIDDRQNFFCVGVILGDVPFRREYYVNEEFALHHSMRYIIEWDLGDYYRSITQ